MNASLFLRPTIWRRLSMATTIGAVFGVHGSRALAQTYALSTVAMFNGAGNGSQPVGSVVFDTAGSRYGTTYNVGANGDGTVYEIAAGTNTITALATFNATNGAFPEAPLIVDPSGNLYGTTSGSGSNDAGTVFEIAAGTHSLSTITRFKGSNGEYPVAGLVRDSVGNRCGTAAGAGVISRMDGTVFKIAAGTDTVTTLATFQRTSNGAQPFGSLTIDSVGDPSERPKWAAPTMPAPFSRSQPAQAA